MNDPLESYSEGFESFRKNIFSSSWTSERSESIPMWKMYSDLKGVRIRLPIDIFSFDENPYLTKTDLGYWFIVSNLNRRYEVNRRGSMIDSRENIELLNVVKKVYGPTKIEYTGKLEELTQDIITEDKHSTTHKTVSLNVLGLRKTLYWAFENEYRFRIILPDVRSIKATPELITLFLNQCPVIQEHIDVEFNKSKIDKIEILLGPQVTDLEIADLEDFSRSLSYDLNLLQSEIKIK